MADLPKSRIEAIERAEVCGMSAKDGSALYRNGGRDPDNSYTSKQEKCYAEGPKKGFLEEAAGWLSDKYNSFANAVPNNTQDIANAADAKSTIGILRDRGEQINAQVNQSLGM